MKTTTTIIFACLVILATVVFCENFREAYPATVEAVQSE